MREIRPIPEYIIVKLSTVGGASQDKQAFLSAFINCIAYHSQAKNAIEFCTFALFYFIFLWQFILYFCAISLLLCSHQEK